MNNIVSVIDVDFSYPDSNHALRSINIDIEETGFIGITGINGSGKTTFIYLLNGLIPHSIEGKLTGDVIINGVSTKQASIGSLSRHAGFVFQNPDYALFNLTVEEEMLFGINNFKLPNAEVRIKKYLDLVGMSEYRTHDPKSLSFGQKQKINLACVLALETPIIVLDEPSAMLDYNSSVELYEILKTLNKQGTTVIVVEHDTDFLLTFTKNVIILDSGTVVTQGKTAQVFRDCHLLKKIGIKQPHRLPI